MKVLIVCLLAALPLGLNAQTDSEWKNAAVAYCKGVNKLIKGVSAETKNAVIFSAETGADLTELMLDVVTENPKKFEKDLLILQDLPGGIGDLTAKLGNKYPSVFNYPDIAVAEAKLASFLTNNEGCKFTVALLTIEELSPEEESGE